MSCGAEIAVIVGPTAGGKTSAGIELARRFGGEIIGCDSRQVYRGLVIGAAQPTAAELAAARHHLVGFLDPAETYTAARFRADAEAAIADIVGRGKRPIIVGGTGLYLQALTDGLFTCSRVDPEIRRRLKKQAEAIGASALHDRLKQVDPESAEKIHPNDEKRIIRALEVFEAVGRPISELRRQGAQPSPHRFLIIGLDMERQALYERIERRADLMIESGLVEEVRGLLAAGCRPSFNSMQSIGYQEIIGFLEGRFTLEQAVAEIKKNTRRYAKRQFTWFRKVAGLIWLSGIEEIVARAAEFWRA